MTDKNVIPFGKHSGKSVEEVLEGDPQYLEWLCGQSWFREKFANLHLTIINRGAEPEDTPDHNALQALFLDDAHYLKVVAASGYDFEAEFEKFKLGYSRHEGWRFSPEVTERRFEENGADTSFVVTLSPDARHAREAFGVEIKPAVGDDYPSVLRQIRRMGWGMRRILFLERYTGVGVTEEQFRAIFKAANIGVAFRDEVL